MNPKKITKLPNTEEITRLESKAVAVIKREIFENLAQPEDDGVEKRYMLAMFAFIMDTKRRPVEYFYHIMKGCIPLNEFRQRFEKDKWNERRERVWASAQIQICNKLQKQIVKDQLKELQEIGELREDILDLLRPDIDEEGNKIYKVQPKSYEGVARVFKDIDILFSLRRSAVAGLLEENKPTIIDVRSENKDTPLNSEEMGIVARAILEKRMKERQGK